ncbi:MAG: 16S rRNA (cytidine1402-2'-O)-methyltransferase [bacterium]|jgi:16S rRNA (cytidine1402-2'-O)-methyltransferase
MSTYEIGKLYIVSTPIGNPDDITLRAIQILKDADYVVCEEWKEGSKLLKHHKIETELFNLNEHNEEKEIPELIGFLLQGKTIALVSDCGTPVFADPGTRLVQECAQLTIPVSPVPGASSLLAGLVCSGFGIKDFYFAGFLPRSVDDRKQKLQSLKGLKTTIVIYDTPYRLQALLKDLSTVFDKNREAVVCMNLTKSNEVFHRGSIAELVKKFGEGKIKQEFILVIKNYDHSFFKKDKKGTDRKRKKYKY